MPRPGRVGHNAFGRRLSARLSICSMPGPKSRMEGQSKRKIGREEAHDTGDS